MSGDRTRNGHSWGTSVSNGRGPNSHHQISKDAPADMPRISNSFQGLNHAVKELKRFAGLFGGNKGIEKAHDFGHTEDPDPYGSYYFALEINGYEVAHFQECSGLKNSSTVFEIEEGGLNGTVHKRPGQSKWENIILKCATSQSQFLASWRDLYLQDLYAKETMGQGEPGETDGRRDWWGTTSGAISLKNNKGEVIRRYTFKDAWPVSWEGPSLNSTSSGLAIETLEIAHGGLTVEVVNK
jgi:phage tail-like protein